MNDAHRLTLISTGQYHRSMKKAPSGIAPLIALDRSESKALHRQIYDACRGAILEGRLNSGQRIPSSRVLAQELGVSRNPVLNAYAQLLAEGYFEARIGSGTVVSRDLPHRAMRIQTRKAGDGGNDLGVRRVSSVASILPSVTHVLPAMLGRGAFAPGQVAVDHFPTKIWSKLITRQSRNLQLGSLQYGDPMGAMELRECIAEYLRTARAVRCEPQQIMIVGGSQHALAISARVLIDPGDPVWVEDPGYRFAKDAITIAGGKLIPVPVDEEGLDVMAGIKKCRKAKAAVVTPSHQYPLGATMSATRRLQLLEWARTSGSWIVEDDYDSEFRYEGSPISSLQGLDLKSRVVYIGTFSKVAFPGLRLAYLVIPADLVDRFLAVRIALDMAPPRFLQLVLADFIREGHFSRHIRRMRALYCQRRDALVNALREEFGSQLEPQGLGAGLHLVVTLPSGYNDRQISQRAHEENLWLTALSITYRSEKSRQGFILGFGTTPEKEAPAAVRKLKSLLA